MNYIAKLNEYGQKTRVQVRYEDVDVTGPDHIKTFTMRAIVNGTPYPEGVGNNKREAKENAAQKAFETLQHRESSDFSALPTSPPLEIPACITQPKYQSWLNEHSHKTRVTYTPVETTRVGSFSAPQCCYYVKGDEKSYPVAYGKTKKEAKEEAAKLVYLEVLKEQGVIEDNGHNSRQEASYHSVSDLSSNSANMRATPTNNLSSDPLQNNHIGILNNYCQGRKLTCDFKLVEKRGPPHNPEFVYKAIIGKNQYPEGCGKTAKEAKQKAAQLALKMIEDQRQSSHGVSSESSFSEHKSSSNIDESQDMRNSISTATSASHSIIFEDSSKNSPEVQKAAPVQNKARRKLAPTFNNAPQESKKAGPKISTGLTAQVPVQSRFRGEFDSIERIGKGAFGRVFKARHICDEKFYAVKIVKVKEKSRREPKALAILQHQHIVRYHNSWIENTAYGHDGSDTSSTSNSGDSSTMKFLYIQMELCEGHTLSEWIKERNTNTIPRRRQDALVITKQLVQAVTYIHSQVLIHRDLKPKNILFGGKNEVKIGDFGLVTIADTDNDDNPLERSKRTGTEVYMSPEQMNETQYNEKVDIFALGLIYFELLWKMGTKMEKYKTFDGIRKNLFPHDFCDECRAEHKLIERMVCHDPVERPDAKDLIPELENFRFSQDQYDNQRSTQTA